MKNVITKVTNKDIENEILKLSKSEKMLLEAISLEREFIQNLIKERKEKGITQEELARITGLTQQTISIIERGKRKPTLLNLILYTNGIGLNLNNIFED